VNDTRAKGLSPDYVAGRLVSIMEVPRPRLRYSIAPDMVRSWIVPRLIPARLLDWLLGKGIGLLPGK
jgi:hypothetical protein